MTIQEASRHYNIPVHILKEYESWCLCDVAERVTDDQRYDDTDLERLSTIMTLHDIGFTTREAETYMRLLLEHGRTEERRLAMLEEKRDAALEEIHSRERQLQRLDYLRHEIRKTREGTVK